MSELSVIIPVCNEEENLKEFHRRLSVVANINSSIRWEFVFVDDGSTDGSCTILEKLSLIDDRVRMVKLSKNFGSYVAIIAGLTYASGQAAVNLSADLQDPPELIPKLIARWQEGYDVVWAVREDRDDPKIKIWLADLFYFLFRKLALPGTPRRGADVVLITRKVIDLLVSMKETSLSIFSLILWLGFCQAQVSYRRERRWAGCSKWSYSKRIKSAIDSFVSFSYFPIRLISFSGILVSLLGFLYAIFVILSALVFKTTAPGYASLMVAILGLSGLQLLMLGIVGEYLWRALSQVQNRPLFIVDRVVGFPPRVPGVETRAGGGGSPGEGR